MLKGSIKQISIQGFKSILNLENFELNNLNVVVGANGAGKSNFIQVFKMILAMSQRQFSRFIKENGGADNFLFNGPKATSSISVHCEFWSKSSFASGTNQYRCKMIPTVDETFLLDEERMYVTTNWWSYGSPTTESRLYDLRDEKSHDDQWNGVGHFVYQAISNWMVYHFHDTSANAPMRRSEIADDNLKLRGDAANIAPFLFNLRNNNPQYYNAIVDTVRLVTPFFDDFLLDIQKMGSAEKVKLNWTQLGSDYPMQPYHLSDGTIRFICLATALLQPNPPSIIIIDEPELGLHPHAIEILAELIESAAQRTQVIVATQSPLLLDQFSIEDIIVINRDDGASTFQRLKKEDFNVWLEEYSVGQLWTKNIIPGGPVYE